MRILIFITSLFFWAIGIKTADAVIPSGKEDVAITSDGIKLHGTAQYPDNKKKIAILLLIAGSGPIDREGNVPGLTNNSLKYLSNELTEKGIATLRYYKRGIGESSYCGFSNTSVRLDDYVDDAAKWIKFLKSRKKFTKVIVAGHSEGSLIGMLAAQQAGADGFISLNGPGRPADELIIEQVSKPQTPPNVVGQVKTGEKVEDIPPYLMNLVQPDIQPYLVSWFKHNPANEIAKLKIPVLIIQGYKAGKKPTIDSTGVTFIQ